ncbi:ferredoxin--NADP+ reductase [Saccharopolyspora erythraea NRRL 2338]|uniref:ferredoxin--NADP(+) reductase n=2 Tax=Saccharopolyspora erythraea TaxID=1836 RepID=A4FB86_SACEN|nr:FAD-dependent oxidoreductase [Saccharopolyspora erythraea]EQD86489.1 FAD-dependent pyridine nucleotide-disulfide oxidoreductase [Saccharopolyspora erythraea D]PFG95093.1 ferredoxin--NADP+ reductase [Saccharopolyspora erythraea NRRL 2338]QRK91769.1 FAD-dependent oxidoreductase [Saccharopolyspora erythraea]CAM01311.1 probable ferredoxin--NADP(+) reductase [Saccharopolyspora erythraea NRRL 2338]
MTRALRVAIVGAGPAGVYAADILTKSETPVDIDLLDRMPAPYGLIRYGVAPDHPRIKGIVNALHRVMEKPEIRFLGNVDYGVDVKLDDLRRHYDAVIFSTGADKDRELDIPGADLPQSHGAAEFVYWYDGYPEAPRDWTLEAEQVAVVGAGNVALDVARVLAKQADDLLRTEIPDNVYQGLKASKVTDVHLFARRGPAQTKFTPLELRELDHQDGMELVVHPEGFELDEASEEAIRTNNQVKTIVKTLQDWALRDRKDNTPRRLHFHFLRSPAEIIGTDRVEGLKTEVMELNGDGSVRGTGEFETLPVQAVYRAVGYLSSPLADLPFDHGTGTVPNDGGRVLDLDGEHIPGVYTTGWIKRGPVGLIGHTKGDALETINNLLADLDSFTPAEQPERDSFLRLLDERAVEYTTWEGWNLLDAHEKSLGEAEGRERVKVVPREDMVRISRPES